MSYIASHMNGHLEVLPENFSENLKGTSTQWGHKNLNFYSGILLDVTVQRTTVKYNKIPLVTGMCKMTD